MDKGIKMRDTARHIVLRKTGPVSIIMEEHGLVGVINQPLPVDSPQTVYGLFGRRGGIFGKGVELFVQNVRDFMIDLFIARSEQFLFAFKIKVNTAGSCVRDLTDMLHPHSINSVKADRFDSGLN